MSVAGSVTRAEDHPQFPRWKAALEAVIETKRRLDAASTMAARSVCTLRYGKALDAYYRITDEI
jgi:hypothetical protein